MINSRKTKLGRGRWGLCGLWGSDRSSSWNDSRPPWSNRGRRGNDGGNSRIVGRRRTIFRERRESPGTGGTDGIFLGAGGN
jgi:hypothetical protein